MSAQPQRQEHQRSRAALREVPQETPAPELCSLDAERAALGCMMMLEHAPVTRAMRLLQPSHFAKPLHRAIFGAVQTLHRRRETDRRLYVIDTIAVFEELRRADMADMADGTGEAKVPSAYLLACIESTPCAANIDYYIGIILNYARLRALRSLGQRLSELAALPDADPKHLSAATQNALQAIALHGGCDLESVFEKGK